MSDDSRRILISTPSDSDFSNATTPRFSGPTSPRSPGSSLGIPRHRPGYARIGSNEGEAIPEEEEERDDRTGDISDSRAPGGLGIAVPGEDEAAQSSEHRRSSIQSIARKQVGNVGKKASIVLPSYPSPLESPKSSRASIQAVSPAVYEDRGFSGISLQDPPGKTNDDTSHKSQKSVTSLTDNSGQHTYGDDEPLRKHAAPSLRSTHSAYNPHNFDPPRDCPANVNFEHSRFNWFGITIIVLSIFSTVWSGLYFIVAVRGPRYGHLVGTNARLSQSTASILVTLFAKLTELSFVTVFVAFLGQALSRRAFMAKERGVNLAELSMRSWIMQPGSLISNPETLRYAALTVLGACSLTAALVALLYTTAADALVAPQLRFDDWESVALQGPVRTSFGNVAFVQSQCATPITSLQDPDVGVPGSDPGATCTQIEHAGQAYHNYQRYMATWTDIKNAGNGSSDLRSRPQGFALLGENTTVTANWIDIIDIANASARAGGRVINNVSLAMPHAGVSLAAYDERNNILQPEDLDGLGAYNIRASVPSPVVDVLCANVEPDEISELVYTESAQGRRRPLNFTNYPELVNFTALNNFNITTELDDIFGWGPETGQHPPMFFKLPLPYNTLLNQTFTYGRQSIYLLGSGGPLQGNQLFLCQLKARLTPHCSTNFTATSTGAKMAANCEDPHDRFTYIRSLRNASAGNSTISPDWPWVASEWGNSISLNDGINDGNSSNARLLTELALAGPQLNPALPSPAEALAVLAGNTLLMSTGNAAFVEFWNYSQAALGTPQYQYFNASIRAQQYASGGVFDYQKAFFVILFIMFFANVLILIYFFVNRGLVTDFSDPANLFTVAVNSPPSHLLAGSCGGGPKGQMYAVRWRVGNEDAHLFMASEEPKGFKRQSTSVTSFEMTGQPGMRPRVDTLSPVSRAFSKYSRRRSFL